jgi:membrane protease YdiL (CAAX protease family)
MGHPAAGTTPPYILILICIAWGVVIAALTIWLAAPFLPPVPKITDAVEASKTVIATILIPGVIHSLIASSLFLVAALLMAARSGRHQRLAGAASGRLARGDIRIGLGDRPLGAIAPWLGLIIIAIAYAVLLSYVQFQVVEEFFDAIFRAGSGLRLAAFLVLGLLAPVAEEMMFRGWLWTGLRRSWEPFTCTLVTGFLWVLTHFGEGTTKMAVLAPVALLLGLARSRSASLRAPILIHIALNLTSLITPFVLRAITNG